MKRIIGFALALAAVLLTPVAALAQEGSGLNPPGGEGVAGAGGSIDAGTAFTGAETFQLIALAVVLLVLGGTAIVLTRRRRTSGLEA
jgi:LPXTG-motif cell wall-anchored protein